MNWDLVLSAAPVVALVVAFIGGVAAGRTLTQYRLKEAESELEKLDKKYAELQRLTDEKFDHMASYIRGLIFEQPGGEQRYRTSSFCDQERARCHEQVQGVVAKLEERWDKMEKRWEKLFEQQAKGG